MNSLIASKIKKYENKVTENNKIINRNKNDKVLCINKLNDNNLLMFFLEELNEIFEESIINEIQVQQKIDYAINNR